MPRQQKPIPFRFPGLRKSRESCISIGSCFLSNTDPLCWALCSYENEKHGPAAALRADTKGAAAKSHIPSIPAQQKHPASPARGSCALHSPRHARRSASPVAALISHGCGCSVMTSRNIGYQYRPRAKAGRVTHRGPLTPGAYTSFMCFLFLCFLPIPSCCYQSRRALSSRTTDKRKRIATASVITGLAMTTR